MGTLVHHTGDIFTTQSKGIGHGVNVAGVMGHGIAVQFKQRFPDMYSAYNTLCRQGHLLPGETMIWEPAPGLFVYNIASQADENGLTTIALPRIGSGIGGLNEREVELLLSQTVAPFKTSIEIWTLPR
jgi:O-acetyl-ADP-ribose deacetylase (regulator of RNase III)